MLPSNGTLTLGYFAPDGRHKLDRETFAWAEKKNRFFAKSKSSSPTITSVQLIPCSHLSRLDLKKKNGLLLFSLSHGYFLHFLFAG